MTVSRLLLILALLMMMSVLFKPFQSPTATLRPVSKLAQIELKNEHVKPFIHTAAFAHRLPRY
jgi:hypothetical protein